MKLIARERVEATPRKEFTPTQKRDILAKSHGRCCWKDCGITAGLEFDHVIPIALGGDHSVGNGQALCGPHHKQKTREDIHAISKATRQHAKLVEMKPPSHRPLKSATDWPQGRKLQSRPFPKRHP